MSQLAGTTCMTTNVTPGDLPHIEDDVITEAPSISTVGPSVSQVGTTSQLKTVQPKVVSIAEPPVETNVADVGEGIPTQSTGTSLLGRVLTGMGAKGWTEVSTIRDNLTMEFMDPLGLRDDDPLQTNRYMDVYPDFHLPFDRHPRINEVFYANTQLISNDNFPMTLIHMPEWEKDYHTTMFGVDHGNRILYAVYHEGAKITNKRWWISEEA